MLDLCVWVQSFAKIWFWMECLSVSKGGYIDFSCILRPDSQKRTLRNEHFKNVTESDRTLNGIYIYIYKDRNVFTCLCERFCNAAVHNKYYNIYFDWFNFSQVCIVQVHVLKSSAGWYYPLGMNGCNYIMTISTPHKFAHARPSHTKHGVPLPIPAAVSCHYSVSSLGFHFCAGTETVTDHDKYLVS